MDDTQLAFNEVQASTQCASYSLHFSLETSPDLHKKTPSSVKSASANVKRIGKF